ncbi:hypothetical protein QYM36_004296 [Artemia franciscana]|uniref:Snurportin-1 n=1 Tax=Artemia franciscana TaxID=6661 RepID=A0AA88L6K4_ARTSF|nr:hypothetical protein QYM36_004296 [Artemia franciscana]
MESLVEALEEVKQPESRLCLYKAKKSPNDQDSRRESFLINHKRLREDALNKLRGIVENDLEEESYNPRFYRKFEGALMISEWLEEIPDSLEDEWIVVVCPVGQRCLVVASQGKTRAFAKSGRFLARHPSMLPDGCINPGRSLTSRPTYIDCIYSESMETYFVLDVLMWNGLQVVDCDTEFRFSWIASHLEETKDLQKKSRRNPYSFVLAPHFPYSPSTLSDKMENLGKRWGPENIDGLLFYHRAIPYISDTSPLVGWLEPFMVPERLGVPLPASFMSKKPADYTNFSDYIKNHGDVYKKKPKKGYSGIKSYDQVDSKMDDEEEKVKVTYC